MLFAGEPSGSSDAQIGLATSSDGTNWTISPSSPVITNADSPSWASSSEVPVSLTYDNGTYELFFNGNGTNFGEATQAMASTGPLHRLQYAAVIIRSMP